jgi:hypothetical protein
MYMKCMGCNGNFPALMSHPDGWQLCLHCDAVKVARDDTILANLERQSNQARDAADSIFGIYTGGRYAERKPPVHVRKVVMTTVKVNDSVIGSINNGVIESLNVNMSNVNVQNTEAANDIKTLSEIVMSFKDLGDQQKEELIKQIDFLTGELAKDKNKRNIPVIKVIFENLKKVISFSVTAIPLVIKIATWFGIAL